MSETLLNDRDSGGSWIGRSVLPLFRSDFLAGRTVAAISLPQSIAYALFAGADPRFGLYTAIVFTAVAAILGLINGPTDAVSLVVFSALAFIDPEARIDAYEAMFLLAVLVGIIRIADGVFRLGDLTRYISESVVAGFIVGAAILTHRRSGGGCTGGQGTTHTADVCIRR